jgi:hypothetical protein
MNKVSRQRIELAKKNFEQFRSPNIVAAIVAGSVGKGYADDNSDIDTIIFYKKPFTNKQFNKIVEEAKLSGGDLYHGTPKAGFAVYYYINGIKCDFGFGHYRENEKLITEMVKKQELDQMKHLQISGFLDSYVLYGDKWVNKWKNKAKKIPKELSFIMVRNHIKFEPEWVTNEMALKRGDILYMYEYFIQAIDRLIWILCGLNKTYHPGKLKGAEFKIKQFRIKPPGFITRCKKVLEAGNSLAVKELYKLIRETMTLVDKHMPRQSTLRIRRVLKMKLRK